LLIWGGSVLINTRVPIVKAIPIAAMLIPNVHGAVKPLSRSRYAVLIKKINRIGCMSISGTCPAITLLSPFNAACLSLVSVIRGSEIRAIRREIKTNLS